MTRPSESRSRPALSPVEGADPRRTDGQGLFVTRPPQANAAGVVNPSESVISVLEPEGISNRNILRGIVTNMIMERDSGDILIEVNAGELSLLPRLTPSATQSLKLAPGKEV